MAQVPEQAYWLTLAYNCELGLARAKSIVSAWCLEQGQPLSTLFDLSSDEMADRLELSRVEAAALAAARSEIPQQSAWQSQLGDAGISVLTRADFRYPPAFARFLPSVSQPLLLFCQGNLDLLSSGATAIVGAHDSDPDQVELARDLARTLATEGINILSGLSPGLGWAVFDGALSVAGGKAIVVLPVGINRLNGHQSLREGIDRGDVLLLSPFHPNADFQESYARGRNRLIVSLASALLVLESNGTDMIQEMADESFRTGKGVYVWDVDSVKGSAEVDNQTLIEAGGLPLVDPADLLDMIEVVKETSLEYVESEISPSKSLADGSTHSADPEEDFQAPLDPAATLGLLSQAGRVPDVLLQRLKSGGDSLN